jgi:copper chaperone CopZ
MGRQVGSGSRVVHALHGRLRIHLPDWSGQDAERLERRLRQIDGVQSVRASSLTRNVLVRFDPTRTAQAQLLAVLDAVDFTALERPDGERIALVWDRWSSRRLPTPPALRLAPMPAPPEESAGPDGMRFLLALVGIMPSIPAVRTGLRSVLGPALTELLCHGTGLAAGALGGGGISLAIATAEILLQLTLLL